MRFSVNRSGVGKQLREKFSANIPQTPDDIFGKIRYMHDVVLRLQTLCAMKLLLYFPEPNPEVGLIQRIRFQVYDGSGSGCG